MKYLLTITVIVLLLSITPSAYSQGSAGEHEMTSQEPYPLQVTINKTTSLVFPYSIKSVDRGSRDVLVQKAKGTENVLLVKAGRENFAETNLSVITAAGRLYSFLVNYSSNPARLTLLFTRDTVTKNAGPVSHPEGNEAQLEMAAEKIAGLQRTLSGTKNRKYGMRLRLNGIYIKTDVLFFQLEARNNSSFRYDIELLRFFIRDEKKAKRTASQEIELQPLKVYGDTATVKEGSETVIVVALPKFTIPDKKYLFIQLMEKAGGRHLSLAVRNRTLMKATPVVE
jgi:conjugative transposon TraN protein